MMRRRSFRRRALRRRSAAIWSQEGLILFSTPGGAHVDYAADDILPSGRVSFLCDAARRRSIRVRRIQLWMNLYFTGPTQQEVSNLVLPLKVYPYLIKSNVDTSNAPNAYWAPFQPPDPPASQTDWTSSPESNVEEPFIWRCAIFPQYDNMSAAWIAQAGSGLGTGGFGTNNVSYMDVGSGDTAGMSRSFPVSRKRSMWHPDLSLRTRFSLRSDENVILGFQTISDGNTSGGVNVNLQYTTVFWG